MIEYLIKLTENKWHRKIYYFLSYFTIFLYIITFIGLSFNAPKYLLFLQEIMKIYISIILILRFNPYYKIDFNKNTYEFDRKIAFSSGLFLLLTTGVTTYIRYILNNIDFNYLKLN
jgi:hypothetical protein